MRQAVGIVVLQDRALACAAAPSSSKPVQSPGSNNPYLQERDNMSQDSVMGIDVGGQFLDLPSYPKTRPPDSLTTLRVSETSVNWPRTSMSPSSWRPPVASLSLWSVASISYPAVMNPRQIRDFARSTGRDRCHRRPHHPRCLQTRCPPPRPPGSQEQGEPHESLRLKRALDPGLTSLHKHIQFPPRTG